MSNYADATRSTIRIIAASVNDQGANRSADTIIANLLTIMDDQRTVGKKTIVMGCWDSRWMNAQQRANIGIVNASISAACARRGMIFLDTRAYVVANALEIMAANAITPTGTDTADLALGIIPKSLRPSGDDTHVSTIVSTIWANQVADVINAKGY